MKASRLPFKLIYDTKVIEHLRTIEKKYHSLIKRTIEEQLRYEPDVETRNRKMLEQPTTLNAEWEIRFGPNNRFRVFYEVDRKNREAYTLAVGAKVQSRLFIGGEEFEL
jgi:mRNA-degrading endonuclease RelE of RelBE toxin-antitoxin system